MDKRTDGWTDGWTDELTDGLVLSIHVPSEFRSCVRVEVDVLGFPS